MFIVTNTAFKNIFSRISQVHLTAALVSNLYVNLLFILFIQSFIKSLRSYYEQSSWGGGGGLGRQTSSHQTDKPFRFTCKLKPQAIST